MSECRHEFQQFATHDPAGVDDSLKVILKCSKCNLVIQKKGAPPRMTLADISRSQFIMTCIQDAGIVATHLYQGHILRDDRNNEIVKVSGLTMGMDNGKKIAAIQDLLRTMVCMSCEREIDNSGGLCEDCTRMLSKSCVSCGKPVMSERPTLCEECSGDVESKLSTWSLDA